MSSPHRFLFRSRRSADAVLIFSPTAFSCFPDFEAGALAPPGKSYGIHPFHGAQPRLSQRFPILLGTLEEATGAAGRSSDLGAVFDACRCAHAALFRPAGRCRGFRGGQ
ncbi:hypothetical protein EMEDMD4_620044 [Sinorhizobium medicae]|uniref:Uncharacterized protein n=1 Tax=Sinorhizobium medicae TaxID=110321 RepID=A0A508X401_9HYPH|nr:hypothetical protein EMEDMD4_620044 [Sinorhizobium medicae]